MKNIVAAVMCLTVVRVVFGWSLGGVLDSVNKTAETVNKTADTVNRVANAVKDPSATATTSADATTASTADAVADTRAGNAVATAVAVTTNVTMTIGEYEALRNSCTNNCGRTRSAR